MTHTPSQARVYALMHKKALAIFDSPVIIQRGGPPSFAIWLCMRNRDRTDSVGDLARAVRSNELEGFRPKHVRAALKSASAPRELFHALDQAVREYREEFGL